MKLGAQLFSLRTECDTPEKLYGTMKKMKEIGYDAVQASAICEIEGARLRSYIDELSLPVLCTHRPFDEIVNNTKKSIEFHKAIGCPVVGLGAMPVEFHGTFEGLTGFLNAIKEPVKMIRDAGLTFAYHNHAFEFDTLENGVTAYDYLIEEAPDINFIHDVYWSFYAGKSPEEYIRKIAALGRITDIHFKDMKTAPKGEICPCGDGIMDFAALANVCREVGVKNVYVEQDNAPMLGDVFEQMERSYRHLCPIVKK
ncbi:MAG: sugar phosphate isomerase/epimerase [Clostridia bacterium]|nr:sugar phosphate isomerase/epimerase [Clostridia bacterium]